MDMFVPTSRYPESCSTPGVVSHTPELRTNRSLASGTTWDVNSPREVCREVSAGTAVAETLEANTPITKAAVKNRAYERKPMSDSETCAMGKEGDLGTLKVARRRYGFYTGFSPLDDHAPERGGTERTAWYGVQIAYLGGKTRGTEGCYCMVQHLEIAPEVTVMHLDKAEEASRNVVQHTKSAAPSLRQIMYNTQHSDCLGRCEYVPRTCAGVMTENARDVSTRSSELDAQLHSFGICRMGAYINL